jgi:hypothetical protein
LSEIVRAAADRVATTLTDEARGPRRNGVFALWLVARVAADGVGAEKVSPRAQLRRLEALDRRLSSLSVAPPLRRALVGALRQFQEGNEWDAALVLQQLVAPAREALGTAVADAVLAVARAARAAHADGER